jgi:hypothetical protein
MHQNELPIPPEAANDPQAFEMMRAWAAGGRQHVSLMGPHYRDPAVWGVFLADLVRHIARSHHLNYGDDLSKTTRAIRAAYEAEMKDVTDWGEGTLLG